MVDAEAERAVGLYRAAVRLRLLAAADEKNVLEVVAVLAEPAQHAPQYPPLDRDGNGREEEKDEQRPPGQVKLLADEQKRQQHAEQDDVAAQQQTELAQEILRAERVVKPHQSVHQPEQRRHAQYSRHVVRQPDVPGDPVEQIEADKIGKRHAGEKYKRVRQTVDLVERALIFLNQTCSLLKYLNL